MTTNYTDLEKRLGRTLAGLGFRMEKADSAVVYGDRPAWAVYYRGPDCKLQVCWSAREGGIDFMLAPLEAPNEFGLSSRSKGWQFLLMLSRSDDGLRTPSLDATDEVWWKWREALLLAHIDEARAALLSES